MRVTEDGARHKSVKPRDTALIKRLVVRYVNNETSVRHGNQLIDDRFITEIGERTRSPRILHMEIDVSGEPSSRPDIMANWLGSNPTLGDETGHRHSQILRTGGGWVPYTMGDGGPWLWP